EDISKLEREYNKPQQRGRHPKIGFLNTGNFRFLFYRFLYKFSDHAFFSKTYVREMDQPMFSHREGNKLLFYIEDLIGLDKNSPENIEILNNNLNALSEMLSKKGIKLHFMPAPDKYTVYQDHILNNPYPRSIFFDVLRKLPKRYDFIDLKDLFDKAHVSGVRDLYYYDDTHWHWKSSEMIAESMKF
ncbi:MAG TPA: hypothetical protein VL688_08310, partial [Verrucomicrobiae bacterium]|nr:hypothetical protein [Verrucomicrobiae bacterium]